MRELVIIQSELKAPKNQKNSIGNYNYRSCESILESVKPLLLANNCYLTLSDDVIAVGNRVYVKATATITNKDGHQVSATALARECEIKKGMDDSQITGTASSYARKYALNGLFAIDDAKDADTNEFYKQVSGISTSTATVSSSNITLESLLNKVKTLNTIEELKTIWNENTSYQTESKFKLAINSRKAELTAR